MNVDTDGCAVDLVVNAAGYPVLGYGGAQDGTATTTVEDNGAALHMVGNAWKQVALNYTVTANTVLEFDFESAAQGEIHAIGFDTDETLSPNTRFPGLRYPDLGCAGVPDLCLGSGVVHYTIPVGQYFTGNFTRLIFANDHDVATPTGDGRFSNIIVHEVVTPGDADSDGVLDAADAVPGHAGRVSRWTPMGARPASSELTVNGAPYHGRSVRAARQDGVAVTTVENGGTALHMVGNAWKQVALNYTVTADTVLEFDFQSTAQGEIHAIGFDTDETLSPNRAFQVYGTQTWGLQAYRTYDPGSGVVHYTIPVGQYFTGTFTRLIFANDHDVATPTGGRPV